MLLQVEQSSASIPVFRTATPQLEMTSKCHSFYQPAVATVWLIKPVCVCLSVCDIVVLWLNAINGWSLTWVKRLSKMTATLLLAGDRTQPPKRKPSRKCGDGLRKISGSTYATVGHPSSCWALFKRISTSQHRRSADAYRPCLVVVCHL